MNDDIFLENFFSVYDEKRKEHLDSRWMKFRSYFFRVFSSKKEFTRLLMSETIFQKEMFEWLSGLIQMKELTSEDIERTRCSIKNFKARAASRRLFLSLFAGILAISAAVYGVLDTLTSQNYSGQIILINSVFLFLAIVERHRIIKYESLAEEFSNLLELWLKVNSESANNTFNRTSGDAARPSSG